LSARFGACDSALTSVFSLISTGGRINRIAPGLRWRRGSSCPAGGRRGVQSSHKAHKSIGPLQAAENACFVTGHDFSRAAYISEKEIRPLGPAARAWLSQHNYFQLDGFPQGLKPTNRWTASAARLKSCPVTKPVFPAACLAPEGIWAGMNSVSIRKNRGCHFRRPTSVRHIV
jgi:hypothetical protein